MPTIRAASAVCVRWRYPLLTLWSLPWIAVGLHHAYPRGDWLFVEMGARTLAHHHAGAASGLPLHLYANHSLIQIGPPALAAAAPFQWLPPAVEMRLGPALLALLIIPALWCAELAARHTRDGDRVPARLLFAGLVVVPVWMIEVQTWGHIDDVIALLSAMMAVALVSTGRHELIAGAVLGTGIAAKPWAVLLLPVLMGYPRPRIARSLLAAAVGALAWWIPFVVAAPDTVQALGSWSLQMINHPLWHLFGVTGRAPQWIRALQLLGGLVLSTTFVRKTGWIAVPVVALTWRVATDPYDWPYYEMGPLIGAVLWDVARPGLSRFARCPWATLAVFAFGFWLPRAAPVVGPVSRLVLFLGLGTVALAVAHATSRRSAGQFVERRSPSIAQGPPTALTVAPAAASGLPCPQQLLERAQGSTVGIRTHDCPSTEPHGQARGTPVARRGRKARGPSRSAQLP